MKLFTLNEFNNISGNMEEYKALLKQKNPTLTEDEINNTLQAIFFNNAGDTTELTTVTEALDEILESDEPLINELNLAQIAMRSMKIKSKQKKANSLKIKAIEIEDAAEAKKDKISDGPTKAEGGFDREQKKDLRDKVNSRTAKKKDIIKRKKDELERQADDKTGDSNFLDKYKTRLRNKGTIDALDAELASAEASEAKDLKRALKDKRRKDAEIAAALKDEKEKLEKAEAERKENEEQKEEIKAERTKAKEKAKAKAEPEAEAEATPETTPEEEEDTDEDTPKK